MSQTERRMVKGIALLGLSGVLAGCAPQGLAFRVDDRLTFQAPQDRATVTLPVMLDWDIRDFQVTGPGRGSGEDEGYFAIFVDTSPMPPGEKLSWVARKDNSCRGSDGCPDEEYLNTRGIYTTTDTELVIDQLPRSSDEKRRERHRATIVLLDPSGKRIGESAFELAFDIDRKVQS